MNYIAEGAVTGCIEAGRVSTLLHGLVDAVGPVRRVLLVPPDATRLPSGAGGITAVLHERFSRDAHVEILPATGTHRPMRPDDIRRMFGDLPREAFRVHDWRADLATLGAAPAPYVAEVSGGRVEYAIPCAVNRTLVEGGWDLIVSIGQIVPHEVVGFAGHNKNILIGTGGHETIHKTHFLGAVCDMETIMGRVETPVRQVLDYMDDRFCRRLPILHLLTVRERVDGGMVTRGLYAGDDRDCFLEAAALSRKVNLTLLGSPIRTALVRLEASEFRDAWVGNKAIYRLRMAMAAGGTLIIMAPGVRAFSEVAEIDHLIRRHGYRGAGQTLRAVADDPDLARHLSVAAHLIHGSSEGRFTITCALPESGDAGGLTRDDVEAVGWSYRPLEEVVREYAPESLEDGYNRGPNGEALFYVSNPAQGLWARASHFPAAGG